MSRESREDAYQLSVTPRPRYLPELWAVACGGRMYELQEDAYLFPVTPRPRWLPEPWGV